MNHPPSNRAVPVAIVGTGLDGPTGLATLGLQSEFPDEGAAHPYMSLYYPVLLSTTANDDFEEAKNLPESSPGSLHTEDRKNADPSTEISQSSSHQETENDLESSDEDTDADEEVSTDGSLQQIIQDEMESDSEAFAQDSVVQVRKKPQSTPCAQQEVQISECKGEADASLDATNVTNRNLPTADHVARGVDENSQKSIPEDTEPELETTLPNPDRVVSAGGSEPLVALVGTKCMRVTLAYSDTTASPEAENPGVFGAPLVAMVGTKTMRITLRYSSEPEPEESSSGPYSLRGTRKRARIKYYDSDSGDDFSVEDSDVEDLVPLSCLSTPPAATKKARKRARTNQSSPREAIEHPEGGEIEILELDWQGMCRDKDRHWMKMYQRLVRFHKKHGHVRVPGNYKGNTALSNWVNRQRNCCNEKNKIERLNRIGFVWDDKHHRWHTMYERLVTFKKKHGHTNVPSKYKKDKRLERWVRGQRERCTHKHRIDLLNKLGFNWGSTGVPYPQRNKNAPGRIKMESREDPPVVNNGEDDERGSDGRVDECQIYRPSYVSEAQSALWDKNFQLLVEYKKKHGNTDVPGTSPGLGNWVHSQRRQWKVGKMIQERITRLESIGFRWELAKRVTWMSMYKKLVAYQKKHNCTRVNRVLGGEQLAAWSSRQRRDCKDKYRVRLLNDIGFDWEIGYATAKNLWMEMYQRLVAFHKKNHHSSVPNKYKKDRKLGSWVSTQRKKYIKTKRGPKYYYQQPKLGVLSKEQIDLLNDLDFVWDRRE